MERFFNIDNDSVEFLSIIHFEANKIHRPFKQKFDSTETIRPIRVCAYQHLAPTTSALLKETRKIAIQKGYRFVWVKDGRILARKEEGKQPIHVRNEKDFVKL